MESLLGFIVGKIKRAAGATLLAGALFASGCAQAATQATAQAQPTSQLHAEVIYVYAFEASAEDVQLDHTGLVRKLTSMSNGATSAQQQQQAALQTREHLADQIVSELQKLGLPAMRMDGPAPAGRNALIVDGRIETMDAGNRRRRMLIGLGAGKSEVSAQITMQYQAANGSPQTLASFASNANSGHLPGVAETAGVGAAAGHLATSAALGGGLHGASEAKQDTLSADAGKLAKAIAKQIAQANAQNGWMPAAAEKS
ncbi:DUF4410 domain-containing protein [Paraburkholderia acidisoli]|uniref:DUF4410 domain-containing protein n=1 Tax=Paraburkholderia acidisoli TaxID=2571748 RepID=A0A7Z2GK89_9BURK|nr:DUF4410 domain-containing protein [Paraburkholderia acidisoli]QGZ63251.1 DUF4410 domain-containing protein [Paraburkholderia acidisoli]